MPAYAQLIVVEALAAFTRMLPKVVPDPTRYTLMATD